MDFASVNITWSAPIPTAGADASPIPSRGGVYEILYQDTGGVERLFVGHTADLRRTFVSHSGGSKGQALLRRTMMERVTMYRFWECEVDRRRIEVVAALIDTHIYECGHDEIENAACIRLMETF